MAIEPEKYFKELSKIEQDNYLLEWSFTLNKLIISQMETLSRLQNQPHLFYESKIAEFNRNVTSHNKLIYRRIRRQKEIEKMDKPTLFIGNLELYKS